MSHHNQYQRHVHRQKQDSVYGFSLLEMVVTVSVFAVMTAIAIPSLLGIGTRAQSIACEEDQRLIRAALTEYYLENNAYPTGTTAEQLQTLVAAKLLDSVPTEPSGGNFVISDAPGTPLQVSCSVHGVLGG